uniref:Uncharacterized protein n=1 Tax=Anopheles atroparvus TaxID=41427 RepID=A0AAG5D545_ANOAO
MSLPPVPHSLEQATFNCVRALSTGCYYSRRVSLRERRKTAFSRSSGERTRTIMSATVVVRQCARSRVCELVHCGH